MIIAIGFTVLHRWCVTGAGDLLKERHDVNKLCNICGFYPIRFDWIRVRCCEHHFRMKILLFFVSPFVHSIAISMLANEEKRAMKKQFFWNGGQWAKRKEPIRIIPVWLYRFVSTSPHQIYRNGFESNTHSVLFILFVLFIAHKHKLLNIIIGNWMLN